MWPAIVERGSTLHTLLGRMAHHLPTGDAMLFEWLLQPSSPAYFTQLAIDLQGEIDTARLRTAIGGLIDRHDILRTAFYTERTGTQQSPLQVKVRG